MTSIDGSRTGGFRFAFSSFHNNKRERFCPFLLTSSGPLFFHHPSTFSMAASTLIVGFSSSPSIWDDDGGISGPRPFPGPPSMVTDSVNGVFAGTAQRKGGGGLMDRQKFCPKQRGSAVLFHFTQLLCVFSCSN